jgi:hypothetical protein
MAGSVRVLFRQPIPVHGCCFDNGWTVGAEFKHVTHGYVATSHASQGKTVDRVLIAMGHESRPAINAEQFYVSVSRGRERASIYTGLSPATLREAIQKADSRKSATELMGKKRKVSPRKKRFMERVKDAYDQLRERVMGVIRELQPRKEVYIGRA